MKHPLRNTIYEKVKQAESITDTDLMRALEKEDNFVGWSDFNKILLDLEIYGLIRELQRTNAELKQQKGRYLK